MALACLYESAPSRIHPDRHVSITATVELHHGTRPPRYLADCHVEFGDRTYARGYAVLRTQVPAGLGYYERCRAEQTAGDAFRAAHPWTEYV